MKILHVMLGAFYIDNYSYQENLLPKYHKKAGNEVEIIASLYTFDENGKGEWLPNAAKYINEHGIPVTRLEFKKSRFARRLRRYEGLLDELERFSPDIIFIHGVQFCDINVIVKYLKKHENVKVYADNHADFSNSAKNWISKHIQHRIIWRSCAQKINPYVKKFYGVLPARVDFLVNEYKLPKEKVELLVMGADDEAVEKALCSDARKRLREKYAVGDGEFLIMTGGKIDSNKPQTILLMQAINSLKNENVKLVVFGTVSNELKDEFNAQLSDRVVYVGWKKSEDICAEYTAADIVAFPGLHSVLWEQAVAMGKPCIFRKIKGFDHVDLGGNCMYFEEDSVESYHKVITDMIGNIEEIKDKAEKTGLIQFSYKKIAEKALEE